MTYEVIDDGRHMCTLPDPDAFGYDARVQCSECRKMWWRSSRFWTRKACWSDDWAW